MIPAFILTFLAGGHFVAGIFDVPTSRAHWFVLALMSLVSAAQAGVSALKKDLK
jgi:hypothetical protein